MSQPLAEAPTPLEPSRDKRTLLVAGGLVLALTVAGGGFLLLGSGGAADVAAGVAAPVAGTRSAAPSATPAAPSASASPTASTPSPGRNPFKALYVVPVAAAAPGPGAAPTGVPGAPVPAPVPPAPPPAVPPTATTPAPVGDPTAPTLYAVKLLSISGSSASMVVDGKTMSIIVGQRFGREGELVVLSIGRSSLVLQVAADTPLPFVIGQSRGVL